MKTNKKRIFKAKIIGAMWIGLCSITNFADAAEPSKTELKANTTITSDRVEMESKDNVNLFNFYDNVHLEGEGLVADCDKLEVISKKTEGESSGLGNMDAIEKITAIGNVHMVQEGRDVKAGRAEIFPAEGKVVLTEKPEVTDSQGTVKGHRIIFYKNDGKAYVEGSPGGERPRIILPAMPDMKKSGSKELKVEKKEVPVLAPKKD